MQANTVKLRGKVSLCRSCGKVFTTTSTFDKHRTGKYDIAAPEFGRRCLTTEEMDSKGWGVNQRGRWKRSFLVNPRAYVIRHAATWEGAATPVAV